MSWQSSDHVGTAASNLTSPSTGEDRVNILLVDDQPSRLLSYDVILSELGETLIKASSVDQALSALLKHEIAVILTDVSMPDLDGFELAKIVREHPRLQKIPIIFVTGVLLSDSDKLRGYLGGAADYVPVPILPDILRAKVRVFVDLHRKTRLLEKLNVELEQRVEERTEQLRESEADHRERAELLDLATEAIIVRDLDGTVRFWNSGAESLYGWHRDEMVGRTLQVVLETVFHKQQAEYALQTKKWWEGNLLQRAKDRSEIVVATRQVVNPEGNTILEIQRDITAQIRTENALRQSEKFTAMSRLAGIIAHEIRNPLAGITNLFYLIRNHPKLDPEIAGYFSLAEHELERATAIASRTLSFYQDSTQPIPISMSELLKNVMELMRSAANANNVLIETKLMSAHTVCGFPGELQQVVVNLVSNAIEAMPAGGRLRLVVKDSLDEKADRAGVSVSVIDTGEGIRPEDVKRLFEPFFTTKSAKGTGLGLWISKGIIEKHGGRLGCRSLRLTGGTRTCFRIFLPFVFNVAVSNADAAG